MIGIGDRVRVVSSGVEAIVVRLGGGMACIAEFRPDWHWLLPSRVVLIEDIEFVSNRYSPRKAA